MSDIVERLRGEEWDGEIPLNVVDMLEDAAAEIERLRAALREIASVSIAQSDRQAWAFCQAKARAALEERT